MAGRSFPQTVTAYLQQAKLIDSIRLGLRRTASETTLIPLLQDPAVDSFVVTNAIRSAPSADSALQLLECLRSVRHFTHTQNTLHALALVLARSQRHEELGELINGGDHSISFIDRMRWFAAARDPVSVHRVWNQWRDYSERKTCTESYNIVMGVHVDLQRDSDAVSVFRKMIDEGRVPNSRTYTIMIHHLVTSGNLDSAMKVFTALPSMRIKRTNKQFAIMIDCFSRSENFNPDAIRIILDAMRNEGVLPCRSMKSSLEKIQELGFSRESEAYLSEMAPDDRIGNLATVAADDDGGEEEEEEGDRLRLKRWFDPRALAVALRDWRKTEVEALEKAGFVWTTRVVCKVLRHFDSPATAWGFFGWVARQPGFTHTACTVQRMITILARNGEVDLTDRLLLKMKQEKINLPVSTVRLMIEFYGISRNADAAMKIFRDSRSICSSITIPDLVLLHSSMLRTLTKCRRSSDALDLIEEMRNLEIHPDVQTMTGLMKYFADREDFGTVQKLLVMVRQSGLKIDSYMLKILVGAYCRNGRSSLALRIFEELRRSMTLPDTATKELLVKSLWKEGMRKEAAMVEMELDDAKDVLPLTVRGHVWTVSADDLAGIYSIYRDSFEKAE